MRFVAFLISSLLYCSIISAQSIISVNGLITYNTTWDADTVKITGNTEIDENVELIITQGTVVEFQGMYSIFVSGVLTAVGTADSNILFTVHDTTNFSNPDSSGRGWNGIIIYTNTISGNYTRLEYCILEYMTWQSLEMNGPTRMTNCAVRNNYSTLWGPITVYSPDCIISNCEIYNNRSENGIIDIRDNATVINNFIHNNISDIGGGISVAGASPIVANNIIVNNLSPSGGGLNLGLNTRGVFINNTICNNKSNWGGGIAFGSFAKPKLFNNIIWGNIAEDEPNQISFSEYYPEVEFYSCNIEGSKEAFDLKETAVYIGVYNDNLDTFPEFVSPTGGAGIEYDASYSSWNLKQLSPCINHGTNLYNSYIEITEDIAGNNRILYSRIDIGANEFHLSAMSFCDTIRGNMTWTADTVKVCNDIVIDSSAILTINPGALIQFQGFYGFDVLGVIRSSGTQATPIIYSVCDTSGFNNPDTTGGGWKGFIFSLYSPDTSRFNYCNFQYGKEKHGLIQAFASEHLFISNSIFENNLINNPYLNVCGLIYSSGTQIIIQDSEFRNNTSTKPIICCYYSKVKLSGNTIENNNNLAIRISDCGDVLIQNNFLTNNMAGIQSEYNYSPEIINNTVVYNELSGIYCKFSDGDRISRNLITNNGDCGISCDVVNNLLIDNNIICNNIGEYGPGIYLHISGADIVNNTIANNLASKYGGGISISSSTVSIVNSIIWNNSALSGADQILVSSDQSMVSVINSDIQDGSHMLNTFNGTLPAYEYINNIDTLPEFISPSIGFGNDFDGLNARWSLMPISPCINKGDSGRIPNNNFEFDFDEKSRTFGSGIDMGAYENHTGVPVITQQPNNFLKCSGERFVLSIQTNDTAFFSWIKDGQLLEGIHSSFIEFDSVTSDNEGEYQCIVENLHGKEESRISSVVVKNPPRIIIDPTYTWAVENKTTTLKSYASGTDPGFQWYKDRQIIPGAIGPELVIPDIQYTDEGEYICVASNSCGKDSSEKVNLFLVSQLCMVTVSQITGNNLVIWEKRSKAPIMAYNIYRESEAAGIYDLMGTVSHEDLSIFVDTTADPTVQAYIYKITGIDTSGYETDIGLCKPHKTIHLLVSTNPELNTTQLQWDKYYGFEYQTYHILRSATGTNFTEVHSIASTLTSWTDPDPLPDIGYYRITVEKPDPCYPTGGSKKADSGPYSHSMSNIEDNRLQEIQENQAPTDINLTDNTIAENQSIGTLVGRLETTDPDTTDHHTYKLVSGSGDQDNNRFTTLGDLLITAEVLDYEIKDTLSVRVKSTDKGDLSVEESFIILVTDVNEGAGNMAPTDITLSFNSIDENKPVGTLIGKFQTTDPNEEDMHTYGLVEGLGGDDNNNFIMLGDALLSGEQFDYETKGEYTIRVRSRDNGDGRLSFEKSFTIYVNDLLETEIIGHQIKNKGIDIYPNPFSDKTVIRFENPAGEKYTMQVTDLAGKVIYFEDNIFTDRIEFTRDGIPDGYYFVELRGSNIYRGKIVIE